MRVLLHSTGAHTKYFTGVKYLYISCFLAALCLLSFSLSGRQAHAAACCPSADCSTAPNNASQSQIYRQHAQTRQFITSEFIRQERWFMYDFWYQYILPAMMNMAQQLTVVGEAQVFALGTFLDAKENLETERLLGEKMAEAHRDYAPAFEMCTIGTAAQSLAAGNRNAELSSVVLTKRMIDRQLGIQNSAGSGGTPTDVYGRVQLLKTRFCDKHASGGSFSSFCTAGPAQLNRDVDYAATIGVRRTLDMNNAGSDDDINVMAFASNLYGTRVFERSPVPTIDMDLENPWKNGQGVWYLDKRALIAKRSVAQNSFNAIVGMKSAGTGISANAGQYIYQIFSQLGVSDVDEAKQMLGRNPSYYALLEAISQKIYQDPEFFTNLYDKPANVTRKKVAMQAINLMLDRETFKSELRTEAVLSVILEAELIKYQNQVSSRLNLLSDQVAPLP